MKKLLFSLVVFLLVVLCIDNGFCNISKQPYNGSDGNVYLNGIIFDDLSHDIKFTQDDKFYYFDITQNIGKTNPNISSHCGSLGTWIDENSSPSEQEKYNQQNFTSSIWYLPHSPSELQSSSFIGSSYSIRKADVILSNFKDMNNLHFSINSDGTEEKLEHIQLGSSDDASYIFKKKKYSTMPSREYWTSSRTFYAFNQVYTSKDDDENFGSNLDRVPLVSNFTSDIVSIKGHFVGNYYYYDEIKYKLKYKIRILKSDIDLFRYCMPISPKCIQYWENSQWFATSVSSYIDLKNIVSSHTCSFQYSNITRAKHKRSCSSCGLTYTENHKFEKEYDGIANDWCLCGTKYKINLIINDNIGKLNKKYLIEPETTLENIVFENVGYTFKDIKDVVVNESKTKTTTYVSVLPTKAPSLSHTYTINYNIHSYIVKYNKTNNLNISISQNMSSKRVYYDEKTNLDKNKYIVVGYTFKGWATNSSTWQIVYSDENEIKNVSSVDEYVLNLYPVFSVNKYIVKYHKENNKDLDFDTNMIDKVVEYNQKVNLDDNLYVKEGWTFLGWNTTKNTNEILYENKQEILNISADDGFILDLYPIYKTNSYKVRYNKINNFNIDFSVSMEDKIIYYGEQIKLDKCIYLKDGWTFLGWAIDSENFDVVYNDESILYNISSTDGYILNLFPVYKIHKYIIKYNKENNKNLNFENDMQEKIVSYNEKIKLDKNIYEKIGYSFLGWNITNESDDIVYSDEQEILNLTVNDMEIINLYPIYRNNNYIIKYNKKNNYDISIETNMPNKSILYDEENKLDKNLYIVDGYTFLGWATNDETFDVVYNDEDNIYNISDIDGFILNIYPVYKVHKYFIQYNKENNVNQNIEQEMIKKEVCYNEKTNLDKCIFKIEGWTFLGWSKLINSENIDYKDMDEIYNVSSIDGYILNLYPVYKTNKYKVVYNKTNSNNININKNMPSKEVLYNQNVKLDKCEYIVDGWTFLGWTTDITKNEIIYKDEDFIKNISSIDGFVYNIYPVYKVHKYYIVYNKDNNVNQKIKQNMEKQEVLYDQITKLDKCEYFIEGYTFLGWKKDLNEKSFNYKDEQEIKNLSSKDGDIINLYPFYSINRYIIKYNTENSFDLKFNDTMFQKEVYYNENVRLDKCLYKAKGYSFVGWSIKPDISKAIFNDEQKILNLSSEDEYEINLFPVFNPHIFTLEFVSSRGKGKMTNQVCTYGKIENIKPNTFSYERGVNFKGWLYKNIEVKPLNTSFFEKYINTNNQHFVLYENLKIKEVNEKSEEGQSPSGNNGGTGAKVVDNGPGVVDDKNSSEGEENVKNDSNGENVFDDKKEEIDFENKKSKNENNNGIDGEKDTNKDNKNINNENQENNEDKKNLDKKSSDESIKNDDDKKFEEIDNENLKIISLNNSKNNKYLVSTISNIAKNKSSLILNSSSFDGIGIVFKGIFGVLMCFTMVGTLVYLIICFIMAKIVKKM